MKVEICQLSLIHSLKGSMKVTSIIRDQLPSVNLLPVKLIRKYGGSMLKSLGVKIFNNVKDQFLFEKQKQIRLLQKKNNNKIK